MSIPSKKCSCATCASRGKPLPLADFGNNLSSPDGKHWYCRNCTNAKQREWKKANATKVRKWRKDYIAKMKKKNRARQLELDL